MKNILRYVQDYFTGQDQRILSISVLFMAIAVFINYYFGLNHRIATLDNIHQYLAWYMVFLVAFSFTYLFYFVFGRIRLPGGFRFLPLLLLAPFLFSWKMVYSPGFALGQDLISNAYWNQVLYWPFKLAVFLLLLFLIGRWQKEKDCFYGMNLRTFNYRPYLLMLLLMVPLVAAASTQPDFLGMYPKLKNISFLRLQKGTGWYKFLYELSYGSDFISIELFFRGFLVLAFAKWFGKDAILPMACFYCTIHFGKPLGECISSFFGGLLLGVVTYHTRNIWGGLMVHLGIAWLMELGGYLGNQFMR